MLLDFTVANYRSIKEPVTLSAVAQKQRRVQASENGKQKRVKSDEEIALAYPLEGWNIEILPVLGIFGSNASGKSNLAQALDYFLLLMQFGNTDGSLQHLFKHARLTPFKLGSSTKKVTSFELRVFVDDAIYTYSLSLNQTQVVLETLDYELPSTKRSRCLFHRVWNQEVQSFDWRHGRDFSGPHLQLGQNLKTNELFIHVINTLDITVIKSFLNWLKCSVLASVIVGDNVDRKGRFREELINVPNNFFKEAVQLVKKFDTGISDIEVRRSELEGEYKLYAMHKNSEGDLVSWSFEEESLGTRMLLGLALLTLFTLDMRTLMVVDEISAAVHPNITRTIIRMFQSPKTNPKRAQLIFTSHDNTLQRNNLLRRDQIWFTQKKPDHSTELYPLTDFKVRNDLAIDKAYLDGRFGAVPILPSEDEILSGVEDL